MNSKELALVNELVKQLNDINLITFSNVSRIRLEIDGSSITALLGPKSMNYLRPALIEYKNNIIKELKSLGYEDNEMEEDE